MLPNTSPAGCVVVREQLDTYHEEFERLKAIMVDAKVEMESLLSSWINFDRAFEQFNIWLKETEVRVKSDSGLKGDLAEKKAHLEKTKVF